MCNVHVNNALITNKLTRHNPFPASQFRMPEKGRKFGRSSTTGKIADVANNVSGSDHKLISSTHVHFLSVPAGITVYHGHLETGLTSSVMVKYDWVFIRRV